MNQMTTGASNDFERATDMARRMVTQWGMSEALGPMVYGENEGEVFLGRSMTTHKNVSKPPCRRSTPKSAASSTSNMRLPASLIEENRDKVEAMAKPCWNGKPSMPIRSTTSWPDSRRARPSRPRPAAPSGGGDKPSAPAPTTQPAQEAYSKGPAGALSCPIAPCLYFMQESISLTCPVR